MIYRAGYHDGSGTVTVGIRVGVSPGTTKRRLKLETRTSPLVTANSQLETANCRLRFTALATMTARAQLQWAYELAFHPARLNAAWNSWEQGNLADAESLNETVSWALMLHQRLPEAPAVSGRALRRLATYQANSRLYRLPTMLRRFQAKLGIQTTIPEEVPSWMVRDIGLPALGENRRKTLSDD